MDKDVLELQYRSDINVVQANELIRSKKDELTLLEAKLIRLAVAQILKDDTDLQTYSCKITDLANFLGVSRQSIHKEMETFSRNLMKKVITIKETNPPPERKKAPHWKMFHWVDVCSYYDGVITIKLSEELKPYLLGLYELFTQYSYAEILTLPTANSISLFELLASYRNLRFRKEYSRNYKGENLNDNEYIFSIEFLREYFNCENKYPQTGDFVKRVIDLSVNAINKHIGGLYRVKYEKITTGRKIEAIKFTADIVGSKALEE